MTIENVRRSMKPFVRSGDPRLSGVYVGEYDGKTAYVATNGHHLLVVYCPREALVAPVEHVLTDDGVKPWEEVHWPRDAFATVIPSHPRQTVDVGSVISALDAAGDQLEADYRETLALWRTARARFDQAIKDANRSLKRARGTAQADLKKVVAKLEDERAQLGYEPQRQGAAVRRGLLGDTRLWEDTDDRTFNPKYLKQGLQALEKMRVYANAPKRRSREVQLGLGHALDAIRAENERGVYVLMPMR